MGTYLRRMALATLFATVRVTAILAAGVAALVSAETAPAAAEEPLKGLRATDAAARRTALRDLVKCPRDEMKSDLAALRPALRKAISKDDDPEVRGLAARALLHLDGDAAIAHVLDAMRAERDPVAEPLLASAWMAIATDAARKALVGAVLDASDVRRAALAGEALGALPGALGADDLLMLVDGGLPWAAQAGACLGLRGVREPRAVQALIARTFHPDAAVRSAARESLVWLTGQDQGPNPRNWEAWWEKARPGFRFPDGPPGSPPPPVQPGAPAAGGDAGRTTDQAGGVAERPTWAEFFGLPIRGSRVAFVIDYSQSMWGLRRGKAEKELLDAVKSLPTTARVTVILFNERVWEFRRIPVPARPQEKLDLATFLPELETKSYTNLYGAVEAALGLLGGPPAVAGGPGAAAHDPAPGVDDVIVLSDGVPNRGRWKDADHICDGLRELNAGRARISCVALADEGSDLLRRLAKENGGSFASAPVPK